MTQNAAVQPLFDGAKQCSANKRIDVWFSTLTGRVFEFWSCKGYSYVGDTKIKLTKGLFCGGSGFAATTWYVPRVTHSWGKGYSRT